VQSKSTPRQTANGFITNNRNKITYHGIYNFSSLLQLSKCLGRLRKNGWQLLGQSVVHQTPHSRSCFRVPRHYRVRYVGLLCCICCCHCCCYSCFCACLVCAGLPWLSVLSLLSVTSRLSFFLVVAHSVTKLSSITHVATTASGAEAIRRNNYEKHPRVKCLINQPPLLATQSLVRPHVFQFLSKQPFNNNVVVTH
jgi:hypothetical protein